jgi:hypothetical protein
VDHVGLRSVRMFAPRSGFYSAELVADAGIVGRLRDEGERLFQAAAKAPNIMR